KEIPRLSARTRQNVVEGPCVAGTGQLLRDPAALRVSLGAWARRRHDVDLLTDRPQRHVRSGAAELLAATDDRTGDPRDYLRRDSDSNSRSPDRSRRAGGIRHG